MKLKAICLLNLWRLPQTEERRRNREEEEEGGGGGGGGGKHQYGLLSLRRCPSGLARSALSYFWRIDQPGGQYQLSALGDITRQSARIRWRAWAASVMAVTAYQRSGVSYWAHPEQCVAGGRGAVSGVATSNMGFMAGMPG